MMIGPAPMIRIDSMSVRLGMTSALEVALPDTSDDRILLGQRERGCDLATMPVDPRASLLPARQPPRVHVERGHFAAQKIRRRFQRLLEQGPVRLQELDGAILELGARDLALYPSLGKIDDADRRIHIAADKDNPAQRTRPARVAGRRQDARGGIAVVEHDDARR